MNRFASSAATGRFDMSEPVENATTTIFASKVRPSTAAGAPGLQVISWAVGVGAGIAFAFISRNVDFDSDPALWAGRAFLLVALAAGAFYVFRRRMSAGEERSREPAALHAADPLPVAAPLEPVTDPNPFAPVFDSNPSAAPRIETAPAAPLSGWPVEVWYILFFLGVMGSLLGGFLLCKGDGVEKIQQAIGPGTVCIVVGACLAVAAPLLAVRGGRTMGFGMGGSSVVFFMTPLPAIAFTLLCYLGSVVRKSENAWTRATMLSAGAAALMYVVICFAKGWPFGQLRDAPAAVSLWPHMLHLGLTLSILSLWPVDAPAEAASPETASPGG